MKTQLSSEQVSLYVQLGLTGIQQEYPNHLAHVLEGPEDAQTPKALHPAFYGCYDWHSAVHSHWMLVRLLNHAEVASADEIVPVLRRHLSRPNLEQEAAYFARPGARSFERPYGWGWFLKLAQEVAACPAVADCGPALTPLVDVIRQRFLTFLPKQTYPIRLGTHTNTAFGMLLALDYARAVGDDELIELLSQRAKDYFVNDRDYPGSLEPSGADFLSGALCEADLMRRVLPGEAFGEWLSAFLPALAHGQGSSLLTPATVADRHDPQIVHLDGLNLSRAWCLEGIAQALAWTHPLKQVVENAATKHAEAGLAHVSSGDYLGEHWLASFAVYLGTSAGLG